MIEIKYEVFFLLEPTSCYCLAACNVILKLVYQKGKQKTSYFEASRTEMLLVRRSSVNLNVLFHFCNLTAKKPKVKGRLFSVDFRFGRCKGHSHYVVFELKKL